MSLELPGINNLCLQIYTDYVNIVMCSEDEL
jgi:hypothetical protein